MLFFFELGLFVLIMVTLALGEFVSHGAALTVWLAATAGSLAGYLLARRPLLRLATGGEAARQATSPPPPQPGTPTDQVTALDRRWARTLLHYWGRTNLLLLLGAVAVGGWYWLAVGAH